MSSAEYQLVQTTNCCAESSPGMPVDAAVIEASFHALLDNPENSETQNLTEDTCTMGNEFDEDSEMLAVIFDQTFLLCCKKIPHKEDWLAFSDSREPEGISHSDLMAPLSPIGVH
jgi:hypothetical protein